MNQDEINFREGIIGVPRAQRFVLLERTGSVSRVLKSLDIEGFALPVVDPLMFDREYQVRLGPRLGEVIDLQPDDPVLVLAIATLEAGGPMANLRAPVVVNTRNRQAMQVILEGRKHPLRAPLSAGDKEVRTA